MILRQKWQLSLKNEGFEFLRIQPTYESKIVRIFGPFWCPVQQKNQEMVQNL